MATFAKRNLSGGAEGIGIVLNVSGSIVTIHDYYSSTASDNDGDFDEIWLWVCNEGTADETVTIMMDAEVAVTNSITVTIPPKVGLVQIIPGLILQGTGLVKGYCTTNAKCVVYGYVNHIVQA